MALPVAPWVFTVTPPPGVAAPSGSIPTSLKVPGSAGAPPRQLFVPDLIAATPAGISPAQLAKIRKLAGIRSALPVDGGKVTVNGQRANVLGVSSAFRSWTPPETAAANAVWTGLGRGRLVSTRAAAGLHLSAGKSYQVSAAAQVQVPFGAQTALSVPGADAIVDQARSAQLGLAKNFAVLINAPGVNLVTLMAKVKSVIGRGAQVINLVPVVTVSKLPVAVNVPVSGVPASYLMLYKASAARYCPGMSWTVLAAIGEIESGNGANVGPSSAARARPDAVPAVHLGRMGHRRVRPDRAAGHHEPARRGAVGGPDAVRRRCWGSRDPARRNSADNHGQLVRRRGAGWPASTPRTT